VWGILSLQAGGGWVGASLGFLVERGFVMNREGGRIGWSVVRRFERDQMETIGASV